jgi:Zn-dependent protease with chaperone function
MTEPAAAEVTRRPRLNPFAFPSDTTFRFVLLIVAVLGSTLYVWDWIYFAVGDNGSRYRERAAACLDQSPVGASDLDDFTRGTRTFTQCVQSLDRPSAWWMLGGVAAVLLVAIVLTLLYPWWKRRRMNLRPLTETDAAAVVATVHALAKEAGLREPPTLVWDPLDPSPTGLAFGHAGQYTVALTGGLVVRATTDPDAFRAVILHELAHIRNRDVDLTYFTVSLWYAFVLAAILPFAVTLFGESLDTIFEVGWRTAALAALVYLTRNAVLRAREVYADVRASASPGATEALGRLLAALPRPRTTSLGRLVHVHPDPGARAAAIADTRPLFRLDLLTAFGAGVAATIAYESTVSLINSFVSDPLDMRFIAALAFAPAVIGVLGVAVWRASFQQLAEGRRPPATWPLGLALTAGFMLGPELALVRIVSPSEDTLLSELLDGRGVLWALGLTVAILLVLAWVRCGADAWLRAGAGRRPRMSSILSLLAAAGVLTVVLGVFYVTRDSREVIGVSRIATDLQHAQIGQVVWAMPEWAYQLVLNPQLIWTVQRGELMAVLLVVILVPLAAALARPPPARAGGGGWGLLHAGGTLSIPPLARHLLRPLLVGLAAGAAFLIAELALRVGLHYGMSADTRARDELIFAFFAWQVALALIAQGAAGAVATAISGHRARVVDGLGAAFVTGSIAVVGIMGGPTAGGCVDPVSINPGPCSWDIPASFFWNTYRQVVVEGAVVALAAGLVTLGVLALVHLRAPAEDLTPASAAG